MTADGFAGNLGSGEEEYAHTAESDALDRAGDWSIRVTVYRNGRKVGTCDTAGHETFDQAAYWVGEGLNTREVQPHHPKPRRVTSPGEGRA